MRLQDLQLAQELSAELSRLDEIAGPAELQVHDGVLTLTADETADFVEWKRGRIRARLREIGIDDGAPAPIDTIGFDAAAGQPAPSMRAGSGAAVTEAAPSVVRVTQDRRQPAMPPRPATIEEARLIARDRVLGAISQAYKRPQSNDPDIIREWEDGIGADLAHLANKRGPEIEAVAQELFRGPADSVCCECDEPATTLIGGNHYCKAHALATPRPALPDNLSHLRLVQ